MLFKKSVQYGCIFICSVCHQTNFDDNVRDVQKLHKMKNTYLLQECLTGYKSINNVEYICFQCKSAIMKGKIPKLSIRNKCGFPYLPEQLILFNLEERCLSPVMLYMTIRQLPIGGQFSLKGGVCHVPIEVSEIVDKLPRTLDESQTVYVKIKRRMVYKHTVISENIRPMKILAALDYLTKNSELFKNLNITIDNTWIERLQRTNSVQRVFLDHTYTERNTEIENLQDCENEENDTEDDEIPPCNTLLDSRYVDPTNTIIFSPGEGKKPIFADAETEYLCFPTIFAGKTRPKDREIDVTENEIFKYELRSVDTRVASHIPNIF